MIGGGLDLPSAPRQASVSGTSGEAVPSLDTPTYLSARRKTKGRPREISPNLLKSKSWVIISLKSKAAVLRAGLGRVPV